MNIPPSISVIIPCYNASKTLARALNSCLAQYGVGQIIVVDDGSQDRSADVVRFYALKDSRVKLVTAPRNGGAASARNLGATHATHALLAFLDADDEYLPYALLHPITYLQNKPHQPAVHLNVEFVGYPVELLNMPDFERHRVAMSELVSSNLVIRRDTFETIGGFPEDEIFRRYGGEDGAVMAALFAIFGSERISSHVHVRNHYHPNSHVAWYFRQAAGIEPPLEVDRWERRHAMVDYVTRARRALGLQSNATPA